MSLDVCKTLLNSRGTMLSLTALDWEKAFDRISHTRMLEALARLGIPEKMRKVIGCIYERPTFCVKHEQDLSGIKVQHAGIRQGCPLSPYLFFLVMSVMFYDIHADIDREICNSRLDRIRFSEILYADDTLLVTKDTAGTNKLLNKIETESAYYGLRLNQGKCCVLSMNGHNRIRFLDGTAVPHADEITYLGGTLTSDVSVANEVSNRISAAMATWKKLDVLWKHAQCSTGNKLRIFDAIVKARLLYGLETLEITKPQMSRLEAFHMKGLRKILRMDTTFINRANTNQEVLRRASMAMGTRHRPEKNVQRIHETLKQKRVALAGHILRQDRTNPLRNISFRPNSAMPFEVLHRRRGRPRKRWMDTTLRYIWEKLHPDDDDEFHQSPDELAMIQRAALNFEF